jgi:probable HAF family extracellular repeat protein
VVGYFEKNDVIRGYLYEAGKFTVIDYPKARVTHAFGINASGQIVGSYEDTQHGAPHGFLLSGGKFTAIDYPGATRTEAFGINDSGEIVGYYADATSVVHGFLDKKGVLTTIDYPGSRRTNLYGITAAGNVSGSFTDTNRNHGFVDNSGFVKLNYPGALSTFGFALNDSGQVVGQYVDEDSVVHAFIATVGEKQAPQITQRLDPDVIQSGLGEFRLRVRGIGFAPGAVVQWNDVARPTTFVDSNLLTAMIPASDTAEPGRALLKVINPGPESATSNIVPFVVNASAPK